MKKKPVQPPVSAAHSTPEPANADSALPEAAPITEQEIAVLAYSYYEARAGNGGSPEEDWSRAVEELRRRADASAAPPHQAASAAGSHF